jgi:hypothetical protein
VFLQDASGQQRLHAANGQQSVPVSNGSLSAAASRDACSVLGEQRVSSAEGGDHPVTTTCGRGDREEVEEGFSAAGVKLVAACASIAPQKIQQSAVGGSGLGAAASNNHFPMIGNDDSWLAADDSLVGSAVHYFPVANSLTNIAKKINVSVLDDVEHCMSDFTSNLIPDGGDSDGASYVLEPNLVSSLEQTKGGITDEVLVTTREGLANIGLQDSMGIASYPRTDGKAPVLSLDSSNTAKSNFSLSLIECSPENIPVRPTIEEVIGFGGIPKPSLDVRTSKRLGGQP